MGRTFAGLKAVHARECCASSDGLDSDAIGCVGGPPGSPVLVSRCGTPGVRTQYEWGLLSNPCVPP
ncbi:hypothetical protein B296_00031883, partial [Ensete ventricosum]